MVGMQTTNESHNGLESEQDRDYVINEKMYALLQTTNVEMNRQVFGILVDLLRKGCTPEAIFLVLKQLSSNSKIVKKYKKSLKAVNNENRPQK